MATERIVTDRMGSEDRTPSENFAVSRDGVSVQAVAETVHDIRNVLALIDAALRMAESKTDVSDVLRFIAGGRDGVRHGIALTNRLLTAARSGASDAQLVNVNSLLRKLESSLAYESSSKARVIMKLEPDVPECLIDPAQFNAAILNLILNAREATPKEGLITVSADHYVPLEEAFAHTVKERYARIRITDTGHGLAPEILPLIFDPFFTTKGALGTGLGLPQVHAFVQKAKGNMSVISEPGAGSTFELLIPAAS